MGSNKKIAGHRKPRTQLSSKRPMSPAKNQPNDRLKSPKRSPDSTKITKVGAISLLSLTIASITLLINFLSSPTQSYQRNMKLRAEAVSIEGIILDPIMALPTSHSKSQDSENVSTDLYPIKIMAYNYGNSPASFSKATFKINSSGGCEIRNIFFLSASGNALPAKLRQENILIQHGEGRIIETEFAVYIPGLMNEMEKINRSQNLYIKIKNVKYSEGTSKFGESPFYYSNNYATNNRIASWINGKCKNLKLNLNLFTDRNLNVKKYNTSVKELNVGDFRPGGQISVAYTLGSFLKYVDIDGKFEFGKE